MKPWWSLRAATLTFCISISGVQVSNAFSSVPNAQTRQPPFTDPRSAEEVVQQQLHYYQTLQFEDAYKYCSPGNKEVVGSVSDFEKMHQHSPYDLVPGHARSYAMLEVTPNDLSEEAMEESGVFGASTVLVYLRPSPTARRIFPVYFWWELSKQIDENDGQARWMVDCILPDFEDLDFETESLSIEQFADDDDDDDDELTIFWDMDDE